MSASKDKGTKLERLAADGFAAALNDDRIDRAPLRGARDVGDISNLRSPFGKIVVEVKNHARLELAAWVDEVEVEVGNADALAGVVLHKRKGRGAFLDQYVTMSVRDFIAIGWGIE